MGELIQFPGPPIDPENAPRKSDGSLATDCDEHVHVFASVPGRCQCGKNLWPEGEGENEHWVAGVAQGQARKLTEEVRAATGDENVHVTFDMSPLLRTEKPKRRWPDDFRGFLSNVRPKRQR